MKKQRREPSFTRARRLWSALVACACVLAAPLAHAAIPDGERQVLLALYGNTHGENWINHDNWGGAAGTECDWFGVTCDQGQAHVIEIKLPQNGLSGSLPALTGLTALQRFNANDNALTGTIPELSGMDALAQFRVSGNRLSGPLPQFTGVDSLAWFSAAQNELSGSIPALDGAPSLQTFQVSENRLSGALPRFSDTALRFFSAEDNQLTGVIPEYGPNMQWVAVGNNRLNGSLPPFGAMIVVDVTNNELSGVLPEFGANLQGLFASKNHFTGSIPGFAGLSGLSSLDVSENSLTGSIPNLDGLTGLYYFNVAWNHLSGAMPAPPADSHLQDWVTKGWGPLNRSVLCPNALTHGDDAGWDAATGETPWHQGCVEPGAQTDLNQHGLSGAWTYAGVDSQGFVLEVFPDMVASGRAYVFAGWFTFDWGGHQRWYTVEGSAGNDDDGAALTVYGFHGGSFATTQAVQREVVGSARLVASDCQHASLAYALDDGTYGTIPLTRSLTNVNCTPTGDNGVAGRQLLSGGWADATHTDSQGLVFDIDVAQNVFFGAWYTFLPDADPGAGYQAQHWYTLQGLPASPDFTELADVGLYDTSGGFFMQHVTPPPVTDQVGNARIEFHDCASATLTYQFASGVNAGRQGTLDLSHIGPLAAGCVL